MRRAIIGKSKTPASNLTGANIILLGVFSEKIKAFKMSDLSEVTGMTIPSSLRIDLYGYGALTFNSTHVFVGGYYTTDGQLPYGLRRMPRDTMVLADYISSSYPIRVTGLTLVNSSLIYYCARYSTDRFGYNTGGANMLVGTRLLSSSGPLGNSVANDGTYVYLAGTSGEGGNLHIFDIATNTRQSINLIASGNEIYSIDVDGNYLYVCSDIGMQVYDKSTKVQDTTFPVVATPVYKVTHDANYIYYCAYNTIYALNKSTKTLSSYTVTHNAIFTAITQDSNYIYTSIHDATTNLLYVYKIDKSNVSAGLTTLLSFTATGGAVDMIITS